MKKLKFINKCLFIGLSVVLFSGCTKNATKNLETTIAPVPTATQSEETTKTTEAPVTDVVDVFPVTVTDQAGRVVEIKSKPEKIVSGYQISSYTLIALGLADNVVGVENKPETRGFYKAFAPDLITKTQVGTAKEVNLEAIISLKPDLVIIPFQNANAADKLAEVGIVAIVIEPETQEDFFEMVELVSTATGTTKRAEELKDFYKQKQELLLAKTKTITDKKSVYLSANTEPLRALSNEMFQTSLLDLAGIASITSDIKGKKWADISLEQLYVYNPEIMLASANPTYSLDEFVGDEKMKDLKFVANKQFYVFPSKVDSWDLPSFASILGAYWSTSVVYPELVTKEEIESLSKEYYKLFFDKELTSDDLGL